MSVYLHPLSIPSRNSSMSDGSPFTQSTSPTAAAWSSPTTPSRRSSEGTHFLGIPGPSTPHIKDADSVDKEANAAAAATASSSPSAQGECEYRNCSHLATSLRLNYRKNVVTCLRRSFSLWHMLRCRIILFCGLLYLSYYSGVRPKSCKCIVNVCVHQLFS